MLLNYGADVNRKKLDGASPLHIAAEKGHEKVYHLNGRRRLLFPLIIVRILKYLTLKWVITQTGLTSTKQIS